MCSVSVLSFQKKDGGVEIYPMKEWLRQHPQHIPAGLDATSSMSHQLRNGLRKMGWSVQDTPAEVRLMLPGNHSGDTTVSTVLGEETESDEAEAPDATFALDFQLRDFIAQNIRTIDVNGRRLRLYVDPTGRDGIEFPTAVGPIDIIAVDESGAFFVFELKRARSPDHAMGQVTRYMGWVSETIIRYVRSTESLWRRTLAIACVMPLPLFRASVCLNTKLSFTLSQRRSFVKCNQCIG